MTCTHPTVHLKRCDLASYASYLAFTSYDVYYVKLNLCLLIRVSAPQRDRAKALYLAAIQNYSFQTR